MSATKILEGKRLLLVDDEPDVIETIKDLLGMCSIDSVVDFETAKQLLDQNKYDIVVLDIMGVNGYELLEITTQKGIPTLMLTAHALSPDDFAKSISGGAKAYIPKEKMNEIDIFLSDLLKAQEGSEKPDRWFDRLKSFFNLRFGKEWIEDYSELKNEMERIYGPIKWN